MNIVLINHYAGSPEMGMEFRPYYFAREWVKLGHKVSILAADFSHVRRKNPKIESDGQKETIDGIDYYFFKTGTYSSNGVKRSLTMAQFISKLMLKAGWIAEALQPDALICSSTYPLDTYVGQKVKKISKKNVKLIHEVHDMWPLSPVELGGMSPRHPFIRIMQRAENSFCKNADKVVSLLPNARDYFVEHGMRADKFICIPNGIVPAEWENPEPLPDMQREALEKFRSEQPFIVGYFGGHTLSNALDGLLEAAEKTEDKDVHFILVGDGIDKPRLIEKAKKMGLKNLSFLPPVPKKSIPNLLKFFDCVYMCGKDSPLYRFGLCLNKMFDSMAAGKPGICALGTESYFSEYSCGFDCAPNTDEVCALIERVKNMSPEERDEMGRRGREAAENVFNYEKLAIRFLAVMSE